MRRVGHGLRCLYDAELRQRVFDRVGHKQDLAASLLQHAFGHAVVEKCEHWRVEAGGIQEDNGFAVKLERLPGQYLEELLKGSETAGQDDERIGALTHERLARVHGVGDVKLGETVVRDFEIDQHLRDYTHDVTARCDGRFGHGLHEAHLGASVDDAYLVYGKGATERFGLLTIDGTRAIG